MKNHGMVCPPPQNQKEEKKPSGTYQNHLPPFFEDFGGVGRQMCPVTSDPVDNCVRVVYRPHACVTILGSGVRGVANARHYCRLHILFPFDEKGLVGLFPATFA